MDKTELQVEEFSGKRYPDLGTAQRLALPALAACLEGVINELIASGELVIQDGRIIPNPDKDNISLD